MLSLFPELLFLAPVSAFLLRVALGVIFVNAAWRHISKPDAVGRVSAIAEGAVAAAFILGVWVQAVAIVAILLIGLHVAMPHLRTTARGTAILALVLCLSLLVTGAGAFAFDLPL